MQNLPQARNADIIIQSAGKEILIYDLITHKAYCLNETLSLVYQACNGKTSFSEMKAKTDFTDEIIFLALDQLKKEGFIKEGEDYSSPFVGMNRREVVRKVGLASVIALPVISSLIAPQASNAASDCIAPGNTQIFPGLRCNGIPSCLVFCSSLCCSGNARSVSIGGGTTPRTTCSC